MDNPNERMVEFPPPPESEQTHHGWIHVTRSLRRFGEDPYPGELRDLTNDLDGRRQEVAQAVGTDHPLFKLLDGAVRSGDLEELRTASAASYGAARFGYWPREDYGELPDPF